MNIEVFNEINEDLSKELDQLKELLKNVCKDEKLSNGEFNVIIVNEEKIRDLNREYRGIDRVTDVISFALEDDKSFNIEDYRMLGDIYICLNKVKEQANEYGHSFKRELSFLAIHGLLHLLGYDHMENEEKKKMRQREEEILGNLNITR